MTFCYEQLNALWRRLMSCHNSLKAAPIVGIEAIEVTFCDKLTMDLVLEVLLGLQVYSVSNLIVIMGKKYFFGEIVLQD